MSLGRVLISKESIRWAMIKKGRRNRKKESASPHAFFFFGEQSRQETFFVITFLHSACGNIAIFIKWYTIKD